MSSWGCILFLSHSGVRVTGNPEIDAFWGLHFRYLLSWGCVSGNPDTDAFWGLNFGYLHSVGFGFRESQHRSDAFLGLYFGICILGIAFRGIPTSFNLGGCILGFAFWGLRFGESQHRCLLRVAFLVFAFWRFGESRHRCLLRVAFWVIAYWGLGLGELRHRCLLGQLMPIDHINASRPRQNDRHFAYDIFKPISLNETVRISIKIPALVQRMVWRRPGDKPLSETMFTDA